MIMALRQPWKMEFISVRDYEPDGNSCGMYKADPVYDAFVSKPSWTPAQTVDKLIVLHKISSTDKVEITQNTIINLPLNAQTRFIAKPQFLGNQVKHIVLWQSNDDKVATTFPGGYVQAVGPGTATITAIATVPTSQGSVPVTFKFQIQVVQ